MIHQVKTNKIIAVKEVWMPGLNQHRFWQFYSSVYSLVFVLIEKIYQTLETVSLRLSKHIEVLQKYSAARRIINSLLSVWKCVHTRSFVFHILPGYITKTIRSILKTYKLHSEIYLLHTKSTYWQNYYRVKGNFWVLSDHVFAVKCNSLFSCENIVC